MVIEEIIGKTAVIYLNYHQKRNALNPELIQAIIQSFEKFQHNPDIASIILTGKGSAFCAGADLDYLKSLKINSLIDNFDDSKKIAALFKTIYYYPKPVIAAVNGPALAGGCGLATACDFIIADRQYAKFGYPEIKIGFIPAIASVLLLNKINQGKAKQLLLTAEIIDAKEAYNIELVNYLSDNLIHDSLELAFKLNSFSEEAFSLTKQLINKVINLNFDNAINLAAQTNTVSRYTDDFITGLNNFLNK